MNVMRWISKIHVDILFLKPRILLNQPQKFIWTIKSEKKSNSVLYYTISIALGFLGASYAAVPLYKKFCQVTGLGGNSALMDLQKSVDVSQLKKIPGRPIRVTFNADLNSFNEWNFAPLHKNIDVIPGETALAFYTAENKDKEPVIGIATYTILPYAAAQYFHKIQCFCFEEQLLQPNEKVDLPIFFYIHPDYALDPTLQYIDNIVLSYTFFRSKDDLDDIIQSAG